MRSLDAPSHPQEVAVRQESTWGTSDPKPDPPRGWNTKLECKEYEYMRPPPKRQREMEEVSKATTMAEAGKEHKAGATAKVVSLRSEKEADG